jgi:SARP family transcriptional regulator, regulator of embCAB operon
LFLNAVIEVFGRLHDYVAGLGFDPADVVRATRRHTRSVNQTPLITALSAPLVAESRLRSGKTGSGNGAASQINAAVRTARGQLVEGLHTRILRQERLGTKQAANDDEVSRHHAVIIDTGNSFMITELRSANGVLVQGRRLDPSATLADGDPIRICGHEFAFGSTVTRSAMESW